MNRKIIEEVRASPFTKVKVAVCDIDGILRGKYLSKEKFLASIESGFGFCNVVFGWDSSDVCYDNTTYTGWHTGYPDAMARIDLNTFRKVPWDGGVPFFLADFQNTTEVALEICPRQTLKRVLNRAQQAGYKVRTGMEFEWFNFHKSTPPQPITEGMFGYSLIRMNQNQPFFSALMDELMQFKIPIEGLHTETGPGVFEAAIEYSEALESADRAVLFKTAVKEIGHRFGIIPSFMAKWNAKLPGCSGHTHQSLWNEKNENLFYDDKNTNRMSPLFKSYLAGILHCLPEFLALYAPTINSYKRLVDGYWAPTKTTWGIDNRTVAARVIPGSAKSTRLEMRVPGSDVNPYLAIAACVGSGLHGIQKELQLTSAPIVGSAYKEGQAAHLSKNLYEATEKLSQSKIAHEILGSTFVDHFVKTRQWEWRQFCDSVTDWERHRYFEII